MAQGQPFEAPEGDRRGAWSRRDVLRGSVAGALALGGLGASGRGGRVLADGPAAATDLELIVRCPSPLDAETPVEAFESFLTPNDLFFVRSHFGAPDVGLHPWKLELGGELERPVSLRPEDWDKFEQVSLPAVLQCAGNGRGNFTPKVPGIGWSKGAVGNAEWSGIRLRDVLEHAGLKPGVAHIHLLGSDAPPNPKTPAFLRSIPLERAMADDTILATKMNGEPLPVLHGGPMRLVVPTWMGNHWTKWLRWIRAEREEAPGVYMQSGYRIAKESVPAGAELKPEDLVPLTTMNVRSLFARPSNGAVLSAGPQRARGVAWTGKGLVDRVEVRIDDEPDWRPAQFETPAREGTWRLWTFAWEATPGRHVLRVRASDDSGHTQPETPPWNKSGYLWNGIDAIDCEVKAHA